MLFLGRNGIMLNIRIRLSKIHGFCRKIHIKISKGRKKMKKKVQSQRSVASVVAKSATKPVAVRAAVQFAAPHTSHLASNKIVGGISVAKPILKSNDLSSCSVFRISGKSGQLVISGRKNNTYTTPRQVTKSVLRDIAESGQYTIHMENITRTQIDSVKSIIGSAKKAYMPRRDTNAQDEEKETL